MGDETENPYAPPKADVFIADPWLDYVEIAWRDGKFLVVRKGAELPDRCLKCNAPAEGYRFSRSLSWTKSAWMFLILVNVVVFLLVYFLVRKTARVTVGLCPRHRKARNRAIARGWLMALAGIVIVVAGAPLPEPGVIICAIGGFCLVITGLIFGLFGSRVLIPIKIDKHAVWLARVSPQYLAQYRDFTIKSS